MSLCEFSCDDLKGLKEFMEKNADVIKSHLIHVKGYKEQVVSNKSKEGIFDKTITQLNGISDFKGMDDYGKRLANCNCGDFFNFDIEKSSDDIIVVLDSVAVIIRATKDHSERLLLVVGKVIDTIKQKKERRGGRRKLRKTSKKTSKKKTSKKRKTSRRKGRK